MLYVTERCVFRLTPQGLALTEVAPGIDIERDILAHMDFKPIVDNPQEMDSRIFRDEPMGLKDKLLSIKLPDRFTYDPSRETLFMNFEGLRIRTQKDIDAVWNIADERFRAVGKKVNVVINYDGFELDEDLADAWADMREVALGEALPQCQPLHHQCVHEDEARPGARRARGQAAPL